MYCVQDIMRTFLASLRRFIEIKDKQIIKDVTNVSKRSLYLTDNFPASCEVILAEITAVCDQHVRGNCKIQIVTDQL